MIGWGARNHLNLLFNAPRLELSLWWRGLTATYSERHCVRRRQRQLLRYVGVAATLSLALELKVGQVSNPGEIEAEIDLLAQQSNVGLVVLPDICTSAQAQLNLIVARTAQHRIPTVYPIALFARADGLVS